MGLSPGNNGTIAVKQHLHSRQRVLTFKVMNFSLISFWLCRLWRCILCFRIIIHAFLHYKSKFSVAVVAPGFDWQTAQCAPHPESLPFQMLETLLIERIYSVVERGEPIKTNCVFTRWWEKSKIWNLQLSFLAVLPLFSILLENRAKARDTQRLKCCSFTVMLEFELELPEWKVPYIVCYNNTIIIF